MNYEQSSTEATSPYSLLYNVLTDYMVNAAAGATTTAEASVRAPTSLAPLSEPSERDELSESVKILLSRNYIDEVGPRLDMFDRNSHFTVYVLPMTSDSFALSYALLAVSFRQKEWVDPEYPSE